MLQVGIHSGIVLVKAEITKIKDNDTLAVLFAKAGKKLSLAERVNSGSDDTAQQKKEEQNFLLFPPSSDAYSGGKETGTAMLTKYLKFKDQLTQILKIYMTEAEIAKGWDIFKGEVITDDNLDTKLADERVQTKIYLNIANQFIALVAKIKNLDKQVRLKLVRSSAKNHFPKFPAVGQFIESMEVEEEASKLAYTDYEKGIKKDGSKGVDLTSSERVESDAPQISDEEKAAQLADLEASFSFGTGAADVVE